MSYCRGWETAYYCWITTYFIYEIAAVWCFNFDIGYLFYFNNNFATFSSWSVKLFLLLKYWCVCIPWNVIPLFKPFIISSTVHLTFSFSSLPLFNLHNLNDKQISVKWTYFQSNNQLENQGNNLKRTLSFLFKIKKFIMLLYKYFITTLYH